MSSAFSVTAGNTDLMEFGTSPLPSHSGLRTELILASDGWGYQMFVFPTPELGGPSYIQFCDPAKRHYVIIPGYFKPHLLADA